MTPPESAKPATDHLDRAKFVDSMVHHIDSLAEIELDHLPAPRVLAIDAPWGRGKSWIATRLHEKLRHERKVAFIDAFRYDHHDDAFAVIASSVLAALQPETAARRKLLASAGEVMKSLVPIALKAAVRVGARAVGLDGEEVNKEIKKVTEEVVDAAGEFSEGTVEKLFENYANAQMAQDNFVCALSEVTKSLDKPFVVIIDELDRCRPTFALAVLERVKHLFSSEKVVFVLFWNAQAIHGAIRHIYGHGSQAEAYLSKFVAQSLNLPWPQGRESGALFGYGLFVQKEIERVHPLARNVDDFRHTLSALGQVFDLSLRDVQKAIFRFKSASDPSALWGYDAAYLCMLKVTNQERLARLLKQDSGVAREDANRLAPYLSGNGRGQQSLRKVWAVLLCLADRELFYQRKSSGSTHSDANLEKAYQILVEEDGQYQPRVDEFLRAATQLAQ
jgi:hypothetical protein